MCCRGEEIHDWLIEKVSPDQKKVLMICQKMLEQDIIQNVESKTFFGQNDLYRFKFDSKKGADNLIRMWREEPGDPYEVSTEQTLLKTKGACARKKITAPAKSQQTYFLKEGK